jgi:hypothetical protein
VSQAKTMTREEAFDEGLLISISEPGFEAGFGFPMAFTSAAWEVMETTPDILAKWPDQTTEFRVWNFLQIAKFIAKCAPPSASSVEVKSLVPTSLDGTPEDMQHLKSFVMGVGLDDNDQTVITVWLPDEI